MSTKERWLRKKYMGVWRWGWVLISRIMPRFPASVIRQITRNTPNRIFSSTESPVSPRRMNSVTTVWFEEDMFLSLETKSHKNVNNSFLYTVCIYSTNFILFIDLFFYGKILFFPINTSEFLHEYFILISALSSLYINIFIYLPFHLHIK